MKILSLFLLLGIASPAIASDCCESPPVPCDRTRTVNPPAPKISDLLGLSALSKNLLEESTLKLSPFAGPEQPLTPADSDRNEPNRFFPAATAPSTNPIRGAKPWHFADQTYWVVPLASYAAP